MNFREGRNYIELLCW